LLAGRSGIDRLSCAADTDLPVKIGGEISDFNPGEFIAPRKRLKLMCREMQTGYGYRGPHQFVVAACGTRVGYAPSHQTFV
jgi:hypothetical protein